jgi:uncharacterized pyridoxamine 5'-phosphate oxidase family protein
MGVGHFKQLTFKKIKNYEKVSLCGSNSAGYFNWSKRSKSIKEATAVLYGNL